ncbi:uncharacterized protein LOC110845990 isoform X2 [Folsomia candida]|uniref:uncharacterized protein LOC110845990 isoform X2 n=1 Tax=Folsomia candida TaxID=158441 RepID=UPI001604B63B|nr:uncharacterized protein LOC110845990 isoform X2 [Folsomia candida]
MSTGDPYSSLATSRLISSRRSASPPVTKVSLLQGRLLSKAHSDLVSPPSQSHSQTRLKSPAVVQRALMGNALRSGNKSQNQKSTSDTAATATTTPEKAKQNSTSSTGIRGQGRTNTTTTTSKGSTPPPQSQSPSTTTAQIKVQLLRTSPAAKMKEILTATATTINKVSSGKKSSSSKGAKSSSNKVASTTTAAAGTPQPSKPPRKVKEGKGSKNSGKTTKKTVIVTPPQSECRSLPLTTSGSATTTTTRSQSPKTPPPPPILSATVSLKDTAPSPRFTVKHRPLAPPAESRHHHRSLPSLTPYLSETRRVTESQFLLAAPRPTKTSLMRHIIARDPSTTPLAFRDSTFRSTPSEATLTGNLTSSDLGVLPRQKRRRSVSCLNLRDYSQYVLALRHSHTRSPRFARLHSLYSSLDRLCELEASSAALPPLLPLAKKNDFDAWWKVRHRHRMEQEMDTLSRELFQAQHEREFFFRPKTPPIWSPDSHLRFKKWRVEELKAFLTGPDRSSAALWKLDLYKTRWRGVSVKELALNLEVSDLFKKEQPPHPVRGHPTAPVPLRRAFSMSSTLSNEQREGIKKRIGMLIVTAAKNGHGADNSGRQSRLGGRAAVTTRMGFTLSSDKRKISPPRGSPDPGLSENKKKEISHRISEELKERHQHQKQNKSASSSIPIATRIALRKAESFSGGGANNKRPIYSLYLRSPVNQRIKAFEQSNNQLINGSNALQEDVLPAQQGAYHRDKITTTTTKRKVVNVVAPSSVQGPASLPVLPVRATTPPFRSNSPRLRSPSPPRRSVTPTPGGGPPLPPPIPREYVSHMNVISKLAALLLRRNTQLKALVTREVLERDRLERLRALNYGEVERLRDYFESDRGGSWDQLGSAFDEPVNLLRVLFCSDSNLARLAEKAVKVSGVGAKRAEPRPPPDGSSPTPRMPHQQHHQNKSNKELHLTTSSPNVCQPTLTAHCYLNHGESLDRLDNDNEYNSLPPVVTRYTNYDPSIHQPRYRYVPPPPIILPQRSASAMSRMGGGGHGVGGARRVESFSVGHHHHRPGVGGLPSSIRRATIRALQRPSAQETSV